MVHQPDDYAIYLLHLWRESGSAPWRAVLSCPRTGESSNFASGEALLTALRRKMEQTDSQTSLADDGDVEAQLEFVAPTDSAA